jgi:lipopolysaccharide cholinephosphotransferase
MTESASTNPIDPETDPYSLPRVNVEIAEAMLHEVQAILGGLGIKFFLRHGTALGAVRDGRILPWDDDIDVGSIIGMHGHTPEKVKQAAILLNELEGEMEYNTFKGQINVVLWRGGTHLDWCNYEMEDGAIIQFPGVAIPLELFEELKPVQFLGDTFFVPNPPERYFEIKYGPDWGTPLESGSYEQAAMANVFSARATPLLQRLRYLVQDMLKPSLITRVRILDPNGVPVNNAHVAVANQTYDTTDANGIAKFHLPKYGDFALIVGIRQPDGEMEEELLYVETIGPGVTYSYTRDPARLVGRTHVLQEEPKA